MPSSRLFAADPIHRAVAVLGTLVLGVALVGLWGAVETPPPAATDVPAVSSAPEVVTPAPRVPAPSRG